MDKYKITSITHLDGEPRTDGRYPKRIGRIVEEPDIHLLNRPLFINYITDENGNDYRGYVLRTSLVQSARKKGNTITVTTLNSIYTFEKVEEPSKIVIEISGCQSKEYYELLANTIRKTIESDFCPFDCGEGSNFPLKCNEDYCEDCLNEQVVIRSTQFDLPY